MQGKEMSRGSGWNTHPAPALPRPCWGNTPTAARCRRPWDRLPDTLRDAAPTVWSCVSPCMYKYGTQGANA
jgi:hypothetical protein